MPDYPLIPRPYQQDSIDFIDEAHNAILSHAPGLGKTLVASEAADKALRSTNTYNQDIPRCCLIVAPSHLTKMWYEHLIRQYHEPSMANLDQQNAPPVTHISLCDSDIKSNRLSVLEPGCHYYIINYAAMGRKDYFEALQKLPISVVIFDESHYLKNEDSIRSKNARKLAHDPSVIRRILVTATPIKREADDLWHQLNIVDPQAYGSKRSFLSYNCLADYTQYGPKNVRLRPRFAEHVYYNRKRTQCEHPSASTGSLTEHYPCYDPRHERYCPHCTSYDANKGKHINNCDCRPYEYNMETDKVENPRPKHQTLRVSLQDMPEHLEALSYRQVAKSRTPVHNPISILSTYVPSYQVTTHVSPHAKLMGFSYKDVGRFLPKQVSATILVNMESERRKVYDQVKSTWRATLPDMSKVDMGSAMAAMHALRVLTCCEAKIEALQALINDAPECEPHLIFTAYDITAKELEKRLYGEASVNQHIAGHIPPNERSAQARRLVDKGLPIIATLQSLSEGVDLSYVRYCHMFETDWTPGVMYQALSRIQRERAADDDNPNHTDNDPIICNYIICENTIDQHIHRMQNDRAVNARDILRVELAIS